MEEKNLLENILTAEILILAKCNQIKKAMEGAHGTADTGLAIDEIKRKRPELIQKLLSGC